MRFENLHSRVTRRLPKSFKAILDRVPFHPLAFYFRQRERRAIASGPPYFPSHDRIIIDITTSCNLNCMDCCRSCGMNQAMSDEMLSTDQLGRFISQSVEEDRKWREIVIEGGEPTLHPDLFEMVDMLIEFKTRHSRGTQLKLLTNGYSNASKKKADELLDKGVAVINSSKHENSELDHCGFNHAPCDLPEFQSMDFSQGCYLPAMYGLGLTKHGFYPHPICGGIDRVFGFNLGRIKLPRKDDKMTDLFARLCPICGFFRFAYYQRTRAEISSPGQDILKGGMTETWKSAYERYQLQKPGLAEF